MPPTSKFKPTLTDQQRAYLRSLRLALEHFQALGDRIPLSYVMAFLQVAEEEGLSVSDYAKRRDISPTVMTRNLLDIGDMNRQREEGLGLVTQERDLMDLRRHNSRVTAKGAALVDKAIAALKTTPRH